MDGLSLVLRPFLSAGRKTEAPLHHVMVMEVVSPGSAVSVQGGGVYADGHRVSNEIRRNQAAHEAGQAI